MAYLSWIRPAGIGAALLLVQLLVPSIAHADDHARSDDTARTEVRRVLPAPPLIEPRLAPPVTYGFHVETHFPTMTEKWIDVDLSEQRVVAYAGRRPIRAFTVSTGLAGTPTVQGTFRIWIRTRIQDMSGGSRAAGSYYYLKNVEWVQYFYEEYAFHGTYWHDNFGRPMSRGCVNMRNEDAQWLFEWAAPDYDFAGPHWQKPTSDHPGTLVVVHE
jgi:hypothetical protein